MNFFSFKQSVLKNNNNTTQTISYRNPFRIKRTYINMQEQNHSKPSKINFGSKRLKQNELKPPETLIRNNKPKIPEKLLKEIEKYNYQRYAYNTKITYCPCEQ